MFQLKVFYNVFFPDGERCEVIFMDQNIQSFEELMEVVRGKIECSRFIPDSELRVQYADDENTLINLQYCIKVIQTNFVEIPSFRSFSKTFRSW